MGQGCDISIGSVKEGTGHTSGSSGTCSDAADRVADGNKCNGVVNGVCKKGVCGMLTADDPCGTGVTSPGVKVLLSLVAEKLSAGGRFSWSMIFCNGRFTGVKVLATGVVSKSTSSKIQSVHGLGLR
jgi:hypothetical protein